MSFVPLPPGWEDATPGVDPSVPPKVPVRAPAEAEWFVNADVDWWTKVLYGPPGFDAYVRVQLVNDRGETRDEPAMAPVLELLSSHTSGDVFVALWDGYGGDVPQGPRFEVPHRSYVLLERALDAVLDDEWFNEPHLVWPAGHAWFIAADVDPVWFTVGCSTDVATALMGDPRILSELTEYGTRLEIE